MNSSIKELLQTHTKSTNGKHIATIILNFEKLSFYFKSRNWARICTLVTSIQYFQEVLAWEICNDNEITHSNCKKKSNLCIFI